MHAHFYKFLSRRLSSDLKNLSKYVHKSCAYVSGYIKQLFFYSKGLSKVRRNLEVMRALAQSITTASALWRIKFRHIEAETYISVSYEY